MKSIQSVHNPEVKSIVRLSDAAYRSAQKQFIAEGMRTCKTVIESGIRLQQLYCTSAMLKQAQELIPQELVPDDALCLVSEQVMKKISHTSTPSGILAVCTIPPTPAPEQLSSGVVLYELHDPGNVGTLIRSCAAMAKKSVIVIDGVDPWHPKVIQASAGTIGLVHIFRWSWQQLLANKNKLSLCALIAHGGKSPSEVPLLDTLFVIGNEAHGLPQQIVNDCTTQLTLSMPGTVESLNAAVAGSIALYYATRDNL